MDGEKLLDLLIGFYGDAKIMRKLSRPEKVKKCERVILAKPEVVRLLEEQLDYYEPDFQAEDINLVLEIYGYRSKFTDSSPPEELLDFNFTIPEFYLLFTDPTPDIGDIINLNCVSGGGRPAFLDQVPTSFDPRFAVKRIKIILDSYPNIFASTLGKDSILFTALPLENYGFGHICYKELASLLLYPTVDFKIDVPERIYIKVNHITTVNTSIMSVMSNSVEEARVFLKLYMREFSRCNPGTCLVGKIIKFVENTAKRLELTKRRSEGEYVSPLEFSELQEEIVIEEYSNK